MAKVFLAVIVLVQQPEVFGFGYSSRNHTVRLMELNPFDVKNVVF